jgi:nitrite reductase/ring-hydroxylating ferredoxin subunit
MSKTSFVSSIKESELQEGQMKPVRIKGKPILLVRQGGKFLGYQTAVRMRGALLKAEY